MADIPNTEYVTVKKDANGEPNFFVGGEIVSKYRGVTIWSRYVFKDFVKILETYPDFEEMHVGSFVETAHIGTVRSLSGAPGPNVWCRIKLKNKDVSPKWVSRGKAVFCNDEGDTSVNTCLSWFFVDSGYKGSFADILLSNASGKAPTEEAGKNVSKQPLKKPEVKKEVKKAGQTAKPRASASKKPLKKPEVKKEVKKAEQTAKPKVNDLKQPLKKPEVKKEVKKAGQTAKPKASASKKPLKKPEVKKEVKKVEQTAKPKVNDLKQPLKKSEVTESVEKAMEKVKKIATSNIQKQK